MVCIVFDVKIKENNMCGIVGYIGWQKAQDVVMNGLEKLEYRGYDSSGIATIYDGQLKLSKYKGRLSVLSKHLEEDPHPGHVGIGHTRWATHGQPSDVNSHPHINESNSVAVIHNGIIENYRALKKELTDEGYVFRSQTDTEVVVHMIDKYLKKTGDILSAVNMAVSRLRGAYALGIISKADPDKIIAVRKESPLIVGIGEGENFFASDIPAILEYTRQIYYVDNDETAVITKDDIIFYDKDKNVINKDKCTITWDMDAATKGGYPHFMLKEINEQPKAVADTILRRIDEDNNLILDDIRIDDTQIQNINDIYIVACGTAYNAGLIGKYVIENIANIRVRVDIASEFRYNKQFINEKTLVILVSQSGETADTLAAQKLAKTKGCRILSITNVVGSSVARNSDDVFYTLAGPEIAVASTKAYTTMLAAFYMIGVELAKLKKEISIEEYHEIVEKMKKLPQKVEDTLKTEEKCIEIAEKIKSAKSAFYIGRGLDDSVGKEGALKLKEISYIYTESFAAGELKHGTIALIEENTPVIAVLTQDKLLEKTMSNIQEVKARGAYTIIITDKDSKDMANYADDIIVVPKVYDLFSSILAVIPAQFIAYHTSIKKGNDVDKPRNLAKSVTVE
ncbi:glutamine-fructose-6-phosphate transaminase (isomerizing) [[Eubacterium] yurii subsp. margaretiae ATCC 43715]|nr:glutamine-fructose-6-phosphate transaminase (isomerizing) [[Eubacterium] yurii subsp. margaretiae ATCC 43715]